MVLVIRCPSCGNSLKEQTHPRKNEYFRYYCINIVCDYVSDWMPISIRQIRDIGVDIDI